MRNRLTLLLLPGLLALGIAGTTWRSIPARAYEGCKDMQPTMTVSSQTVNGGESITVVVTVTDCDGNPKPGVHVHFHSNGPCPVTFQPPDAVTDQNGQAKTTATFPQNCPGQYIIIGDVQGFNGVQPQIPVFVMGGFPNTTPDDSQSTAPETRDLLIIALGLLVLTGGLTYLRLSRG